MNILKKRVVASTVLATFLCMSLTLLPGSAFAQYANNGDLSGYAAGEPTVYDVILDGVLVRPINLVLAVAGSGLFLITLPFSLIAGNPGKAAEKLVGEPAKDFIHRCFGCVREGRQWADEPPGRMTSYR